MRLRFVLLLFLSLLLFYVSFFEWACRIVPNDSINSFSEFYYKTEFNFFRFVANCDQRAMKFVVLKAKRNIIWTETAHCRLSWFLLVRFQWNFVYDFLFCSLRACIVRLYLLSTTAIVINSLIGTKFILWSSASLSLFHFIKKNCSHK